MLKIEKPVFNVCKRYVFLVLNTLQGLFILVFFTCSKKVMGRIMVKGAVWAVILHLLFLLLLFLLFMLFLLLLQLQLLLIFFQLQLITSILQVVTSVRERVCGSSEEQPSPWLWQHQQGTTASRLSSFSLLFLLCLFLYFHAFFVN